MNPELDLYPPVPRRSILAATGAILGVVAAGDLLEACGSPERDPFEDTPAWAQDFSTMPDGALDTRLWSISTGTTIPGYNQEVEALTDLPQNIRIENGALILEGKREGHPYEGRDYTSARIVSKHAFTYGKLEVAARFPAGAGTWPALWLLPNKGLYQPQRFGIDPTSNSAWAINGEIDFGEAVGKKPGIITSSLHTYQTVSTGQAPAGYANQEQVPTISTDFNTYGVERTPGKIVFTLNGQPYQTIEKPANSTIEEWPFENQPMNLIMNLALGGAYGGPVRGNGPWQLAVKSAKFFALAV